MTLLIFLIHMLSGIAYASLRKKRATVISSRCGICLEKFTAIPIDLEIFKDFCAPCLVEYTSHELRQAGGIKHPLRKTKTGLMRRSEVTAILSLNSCKQCSKIIGKKQTSKKKSSTEDLLYSMSLCASCLRQDTLKDLIRFGKHLPAGKYLSISELEAIKRGPGIFCLKSKFKHVKYLLFLYASVYFVLALLNARDLAIEKLVTMTFWFIFLNLFTLLLA
jgi:hypothetical protein